MSLEILGQDLSKVWHNPALKRGVVRIGLTGLSIFSVLTDYIPNNNLYSSITALAQNNEQGIQFTPHIMGIYHGPDRDYIHNNRTGKIVFPRGHNWTPVYWDREIPAGEPKIHDPVPGGHTFAHPDFFKAEEIDAVFAKMDAYKATPEDDAWVRLFLNEYTMCGSDGKLSNPVLQNIDTTLRLAKKHNIFIDLTLNKIPFPCYIPAGIPSDFEFEWENALLMSKEGVDARMKYLKDLLIGLYFLGSPTEHIGIISLENEWQVNEDQKPLSLTSGIIKAANNRQYDMAKPEDKKRIVEDSLVYISMRAKQTLLEVDPTALLGMGFYAPMWVEGADTRVIYTLKALTDKEGSMADIHLLHRYEGNSKTAQEEIPSFLERAYTSFNQITRKPIIWEEFGAFKNDGIYPTGIDNEVMAAMALVRDQAQSCQMKDKGVVVGNVSGWFVWGLGLPIKPPYIISWNPEEGKGLIYNYISSKYRPDPCSVEPISSVPKLTAPFRRLIPLLKN